VVTAAAVALIALHATGNSGGHQATQPPRSATSAAAGRTTSPPPAAPSRHRLPVAHHLASTAPHVNTTPRSGPVAPPKRIPPGHRKHPKAGKGDQGGNSQ
jgi:hypothetical protein